MCAVGSPAEGSGTWLFDAADCAHAFLGHVRGAIRMMAGAPGPGWRGGPWGRRQSRPGGFGEWPGGPGGPWRGWWPGPPGFARGPKASRGDVRAAILALLREGPRNGYQIMSEIQERSGGAWRPSPGAVYPALQQLADEGLIEAEESSGRRTFSLTEAGRRHIEENPETARAAWESMAADSAEEMPGLFAQAAQLAASIVQMAHAGTPEQMRAAEALLEQTRRQMYQILADGGGSEQQEEQE
jgi:DNA-binding PadR family transcriptional regulator